jgi:MinD-like ATPase involved in chromosome partitioning or flagellar assembly
MAKHIILADARADFGYELTNRAMIDERPVTAEPVTSLEDAVEAARSGPGILVICDNLADGIPHVLPSLPPGFPVCGYACSPGGISAFARFGIHCLGFIQKTPVLLDMIESGEAENAISRIPPPNFGAAGAYPQPPQPPQPPQGYGPPPPAPQGYGPPPQAPQGYRPPQAPARHGPAYPQQAPTYPGQAYPPAPAYPPAQGYPPPERGWQTDGYDPRKEETYGPEPPRRDEHGEPYRYDAPAGDGRREGYGDVPPEYDGYGNPVPQAPYPGYGYYAPHEYGGYGPPPSPYPYDRGSGGRAPEDRTPPAQGYGPPQTRGPLQGQGPATVQGEPKQGPSIDKSVSGTKVVTVYSAKGGVGKTTLAAEIGVCLALTSRGDERFRVCVADCNIDFGNIATTLDLDAKGVSMSHFAAEIRERVRCGEPYESVMYGRRDLEDTWLQMMPDTGLYALLAPDSHEDSMYIGEAEMSTMLKNIIENGEFDFVICDTGNNTRDSSVIALEAADFVFMIATQDVTTADCNDAFLATMRKLGFDTDKIRLIVNMVKPHKATGISVEEIEESFDFPCIARIDASDDVIKANNYGKPLVYDPKHKFTVQIRKIAAFLTGGPVRDDSKKGLFGKKK